MSSQGNNRCSFEGVIFSVFSKRRFCFSSRFVEEESLGLSMYRCKAWSRLKNKDSMTAKTVMTGILVITTISMHIRFMESLRPFLDKSIVQSVQG